MIHLYIKTHCITGLKYFGFSTKNNIVRSPEWANMIVENALDGAPNGHEGHKVHG